MFYLEQIMKLWNEKNPHVEMIWSHPAKYVAALKDTNKQMMAQKEGGGFPIRRDDTFPFAQNTNQWWSGFFSTRPNFKKLIKDTSALLHSSLDLISKEVLKAKSIISYQIINQYKVIN